MTVPEVYCSNKSVLIQTSVFQVNEGRMSFERNVKGCQLLPRYFRCHFKHT